MSKLLINNEKKLNIIEKEVYGHFSEHLGRCIYEGVFVGENADIPNINGMKCDVVDALKEMKIPVLRWPGGCFADEYHWKDGVGPKENRKKMINTHWGGVLEDNSFGTHEYFELCRQLGCETYVSANFGSGSVREMSEWVEYMTFKGVSPMADMRKKNGHEEPWTLDYIGVGNETWGGGGNMRPVYYADEYRRYQTYVRNYDDKKKVAKICCGPNAEDYAWTRDVLQTCFERSTKEQHGFMDGLSLHYYTTPEFTDDWEHKGSATVFSEEVFYKTLRKAYYMDELIRRHSSIMDEFDPDKKIGLMVDEWGMWTDVEPGTNPGFLYQQNTMRDALVAAITLNLFNKHSDRVRMGCIAQLVNVLQAVILTDKEKMIKTPTYFVFHMYRFHKGAELLESTLLSDETVGNGEDVLPKVLESVSLDETGVITVTLTNNSLEEKEDILIQMTDGTREHEVKEAFILSGKMDAHNTFEKPETVREELFKEYKNTNKGIEVSVPACSVVCVRLICK